MKLISPLLFLFFFLFILSCDDEKVDILNIECPCIFKDNQPPYLKSCKELGLEEERWSCMIDELLDHIYTVIKYPAAAVDSCIEGSVVVAVLINTEGRVLKSEIRSDTLGYGLEEEALRIIQLINDRWCPGLINCQAVEQEFTMPVKFKLADC